MNGFKIPTDLCPEAKKFIKGIVLTLEEQGVLTTMDFEPLKSFAEQYDVYIAAKKMLKEDGYFIKTKYGEPKTHPAVKIITDAQIQLNKYYDAFGLTPKSRKEIQKSKEREKELTPIDMFIEQVKKA